MAASKADSSEPVEFPFDFEKFLAVVQYLAQRQIPELTKFKICKLLFLADKYHLVRYGRPVVGGTYCALPHGPIPSEALDLLNYFIGSRAPEWGSSEIERQIQMMKEALELDRGFQNPRFVKGEASPRFQLLSKSDLMALDHVIETFGSSSFGELQSLTHSVSAYLKGTEPTSGARMRYEDFFEDDPDAVEGAFEEMVENDQLRRRFPPIEGF